MSPSQWRVSWPPASQTSLLEPTESALGFAGVPFAAAKFQVFEGLGECYWTPYYHMHGEPIWNLVFEAVPGVN